MMKESASILILFVLMAAFVPGTRLQSSQSSDPDTVREAMLADGATIDDHLALLRHPELMQEREVQAKLMRGLRSDEMADFQAAAALALVFPEIDFQAPRVWRRLENSFLSTDSTRKLALLQLALERPQFREDLRIVGLVADALLEADDDLSRVALQLAEQDGSLANNPAVAEALAEEQGRSKPASIPDFELFQEEIMPILTSPGSDLTACVECHKTRSIMRLRTSEELPDDSQRARQYYRSLLRVIDPADPEQSLLLRKPTRPAPKTQPAPASLDTHTGGARFEVGDATYRKILDWIRSGH